MQVGGFARGSAKQEAGAGAGDSGAVEEEPCADYKGAAAQQRQHHCNHCDVAMPCLILGTAAEMQKLAANLRSGSLEYVLEARVLLGTWIPLLEALTRGGQLAFTKRLLRHMQGEAKFNAGLLSLVVGPGVFAKGGGGAVLLRQDLFSLYCKLASEGVKGPALEQLWVYVGVLGQEGPADCVGAPSSSRSALARRLLGLLSADKPLESAARLSAVQGLLAKARTLTTDPPLMYAVTWVSWLEALGLVWKEVLRLRYSSPGPLRAVLVRLQAAPCPKTSKVFRLELLLLQLLDLMHLRLGEDGRPSLGQARVVVSVLGASLVQLRRDKVFEVLSQAKDCLQFAEWVWPVAAVQLQCLPLLQFFLLHAPERRGLPERQAQTLLELACSELLAPREGDGLSVVSLALPFVLCTAGLLSAVQPELGDKWLEGWEWEQDLCEPRGRWLSLRPRLLAQGVGSLAQLLSSFHDLSEERWGGGAAAGDDEAEAAAEAGGEAEEGAAKQRLAMACLALETQRQELAKTQDLLRELERQGRELRSSAGDARQELQRVQQELQEARSVRNKIRHSLRRLQKREGKKNQTPPPQEPAQRSGKDEDEQEEEDEGEKAAEESADHVQCAVCLNDPGKETGPLVVLVSCGHARICADCAAQLRRCPLCRREIKEFVVPV